VTEAIQLVKYCWNSSWNQHILSSGGKYTTQGNNAGLWWDLNSCLTDKLTTAPSGVEKWCHIPTVIDAFMLTIW